MHKTTKLLIVSATVLLFIGAILGALGSHALDNILTAQKKESWQLAVQYQLVHGVGMIIVALMYEQFKVALMRWSGALMFAGILMFSGSIYISAVGGPQGITQIAPLGGSSFMLAWLLLGAAVMRLPRP